MSSTDPSETELLRRAALADPSAVGCLLERHRARLRQMVAFRLEDRLTARVDPSDVVQEAMIEASQRLPEYLQHQRLPLYVWLRQIVCERIAKLYRRHVVAQKRSVNRELHHYTGLNENSSALLAHHFVTSGTSPSGRLMREERRCRVQAALARLKKDDQEVLLLRHLEQLSIGEMAAVLGITPTATKSRHFRALLRLQTLLGEESATG